jgi:signal transduction histidine kinase
MIANIIIFTGIINLILGVVVISGARTEKGKLSFALFAFSTLVWSLADFFVYKTHSAIFDKLAYSSAVLIPTFLLIWIFDLQNHSKKRITRLSIGLIGLLFILLPLINNLVITSIKPDSITGTTEEVGPLFIPYLAFFVLTYLFVLYKLVRHNLKSLGEEKNRYRTILIGFLLYGAGSILFGLILPAMGYEKFTNFDVSCSLIFVGFTTYAIVQYKWMNIKVVAFELLAIFIIGASLMEIFVADTPAQRIYKATMFAVLTTLSIFMVKSVLSEVKRKEELEVANSMLEIANYRLEIANQEISERKEQLQKMSDSLAKANDQLKRLDRAKTEFVSRAYHDLRAPITGIKGYVSLLMEGSYGQVAPEQMEVLKKTFSITGGMSTLTEDLLSASKLESGGMSFDFKRHKIEDICQQIVDTLYPKAKDMGLYLEYRKPAERLPELLIDGSRIRESLSNLVDNAIKYTKSGGVTLCLERAETSDYKAPVRDQSSKQSPAADWQSKGIVGPVVRITVTDTGIGIPKTEIPYLFARFSRGKDPTRLNAGGTGLGLYICKGIIEDNGGKVWAQSDGEVKGSRFIVELPIRLSDEIRKSK